MTLLKAYRFIFIGTLLALGYIFLQMQIYALAYQRLANERKMRELSEGNSHISRRIITLKSARYLGGTLLTDKSDMHFMNPDRVIALKVPKKFSAKKTKTGKTNSPVKKTHSLLTLLSLPSKAEAGFPGMHKQ